jgi:hypothetical protein
MRALVAYGVLSVLVLATSAWLGWVAASQIKTQAEEMARLLGVMQVLAPLSIWWLVGRFLSWLIGPWAEGNYTSNSK